MAATDDASDPNYLLLIEDNPDDAFLVAEGLSEGPDGRRVAVAGDGAEALEFLRGRLAAPDRPLPLAILLDLGLPKKSGLEVLREIKGDARLRGIPVIIMTSSDDKAHMMEACNLQINGYLAKPFTDEQLRKAIRSIDRFWFSSVLESLPDAVVVTDGAFRITLVNGQAERLFHATRGEMLGRPMRTLLAGDRREEYLRHLGAYYGSPAPRADRIEFETRGVRRDGGEFPLQVSLGLLQADGGVLVAATMRDISAQKRTESALVGARDELETTVHERTCELTDAFVEQQVLLKEIHHRVKNNLQLISSMIRRQARLTRRSAGNPDPPGRDRLLDGLGEIQSRIQSMALVHEMLYRSKSLAAIDFSVYLVQLTDHLRRAFDSSASVALRVEAEGVSVDIDTAIRCGLIVTELVSNGYKHAFPDDRRGEIAVGLRAAPGGRFLLTVSDDGVGGSPPAGGANTGSLGLQLVRDLAADLDAAVETVLSPGTTHRILFTPLAARS